MTQESKVVPFTGSTTRVPRDLAASTLKAHSDGVHISERHQHEYALSRIVPDEDAAWSRRFEDLQATLRNWLYSR
jgi:hypothetical protein